MANIKTTLHPEGVPGDNLYPNILKDNLPAEVITLLNQIGINQTDIQLMQSDIENNSSDIKNNTDDITSLNDSVSKHEIEIKNLQGTKANIDGSYDSLTVGVSKQIYSPDGLIDNGLYHKRISANGASISSGLAELIELRGYSQKSINRFSINNESKEIAEVYNNIIYLNGSTTSTISFISGKRFDGKYISVELDGVEAITNDVGRLIQVNVTGANGEGRTWNLTELGKRVEIIPFDNEFQVKIYIMEGTAFTRCSLKIMVSYEDLTSIEYQPHFEGLLNSQPSNISSTTTQLCTEEWEIGGIRTDNGQNGSGTGIRSKKLIPIINNKDYTVHDLSDSYSAQVYLYDINGRFINYYYVKPQQERVFEKYRTKDVYYVRFSFSLPVEDIPYNKWLMFNYGLKAKPYEEYAENNNATNFISIFNDGYNYMRSAGDYSDYINKKESGRDVYPETTLNGSENWRIVKNDSYSFFALTLDHYTKPGVSLKNTSSTYIDKPFKEIRLSTAMGGVDGMSANSNLLGIHISRYENDLEGFKAWLSRNPITFTYARQEAITKPNTHPTLRYMAYDGGIEHWSTSPAQEIEVGVGTTVKYLDDLAGKLRALPTKPEYEETLASLDARIKALEKGDI